MRVNVIYRGENSLENDSRLEAQLVWKFLGISAFLADRAEIAAARLILRNICGWQRNRERMIFLRTYYYYLTVNSFLEIVFKVNLELIWLEVEKVEKAFERYVPYRWLRSAISTDSTFAFTYFFFSPPFVPFLLAGYIAICWNMTSTFTEYCFHFIFGKRVHIFFLLLFNSPFFTLSVIVICSGQKHAMLLIVLSSE